MAKTLVQSTVVDSYEVTDEGLVVTIKGQDYLYPEATMSDLKGLENAESKGRFLATVLYNQPSVKI